jgi:beta-N-acetylhexosaminidase
MRLRQRNGEPTDGPSDFEWPGRVPGAPPVEPAAPPPRRGRLGLSDAPVHRRRRLVALVVVGALVAGAGVALALLIGGEAGLSPRERAQLEAAGASGRSRPAGVSSLVQRTAAGMSLPRQVAQLFLMGTTAQGPGDAFFPRLRARGWGAVVLSSLPPGQAGQLAPHFGAVARQAGQIAPLVAAAQPGGQRSTFPGLPPRAPPLIGDKPHAAGLAAQQAAAAARALRRLHVTMTFAPVADVATPTGPGQDLDFSDSARAVAQLTAAAVGAYRRGGVVPAVGHFPGQGSANADPDIATATVGLGLDDLRRRDLLPFRAIARTVPVVIVSNAVYAAYDGVTPAVLLPDVVGGLLRRQLGFKGVVMTDDLVSTAPVLGQSVARSAVEALEAGADLLYVSGGTPQQEQAYRAVLAAVRRGTISRRRLQVSVERVLALKRGYGLLAAPRRPVPPGRARPGKPAPRSGPGGPGFQAAPAAPRSR